MKPFGFGLLLGLMSLPVAAWANRNPNFDDDAKPILRLQPGLIQYVETRFEVRDTGLARIPGDNERHPVPPYIFMARPRGYSGDFYVKLVIQPGQPGHVLKVVDPTQAQAAAPSPASPPSPNGPPPTPPPGAAPASPPAPAPVPPPVNPNPTASASPPAAAPLPAPTPAPPPVPAIGADTPSGAISADGQVTPFSAPPSSTPSLAPPPEPVSPH